MVAVAPGSFESFGNIHVSDQLADDDQLELDRLVDSHNLERSGIQDAKLLSIMLRSRGGGLFAGLHGYTWGGYCEIKSLWVAEQQRRLGLGSALLAAAEHEATDRGCRRVLLTTHSFQAPDFYSRFGFEVAGYIDDYPIGHRSIYLRKGLR